MSVVLRDRGVITTEEFGREKAKGPHLNGQSDPSGQQRDVRGGRLMNPGHQGTGLVAGTAGRPATKRSGEITGGHPLRQRYLGAGESAGGQVTGRLRTVDAGARPETSSEGGRGQ